MPEPIQLTPEQIARFRENGFLALDAIASAAEVEQLRSTFERLFQERAGWKKGAQFDLAGTDDGRPAKLPQLLNPVEFAPELRDTEYRASALAIARQLLGPETEQWFEHAILKPPHYGAETPWHQDEAHRDDAGTEYEQISIWMPLQEATQSNGCMRYIARSHLGPILEHRSPNNDPRITALECIGGFNPAQAVHCPLPPGGAALHHCRTLHGAGANHSDLPRCAYILAFRGPVRPNPEFRGYPWNAQKHTAAQDRRVSWENRGGAVGRAARGAGEAIRRTLKRVRSRVGRLVR
ncbi:MAG TPA: phytanoyl-CoA dioxygenase family protein [Chthoniobacter sp.]|nr:phytanoyl-CoA dioxygenase family protein [Chthoniobacter sp.]